MPQDLVHATCVVAPDGQAVLLRGPSGAGKSDLALRLIDRGWRLVSDDQTRLSVSGGRLLARAPKTIAGKMEVRGLGILNLPRGPEAFVSLVVDLVPEDQIERLPEPETTHLSGADLPTLKLNPLSPSAPIKLSLALADLGTLYGEAAITRLMAQDCEAVQNEEQDQVREEAMTVDLSGQSKPTRVVLVTGLSGAGRTAALDTLEDLNYEAIDNPPLELVNRIIDTAGGRPVALGIDIRTRDFAAEPFLKVLDLLKADAARSVQLLFVDCDDEVLRRRFSETRRRHPLAEDRPLLDGILTERRLLAPLRSYADLIIDTSTLTPGDFRQVLTGHLANEDDTRMAVFVSSFSFRIGLPRSADLVFDVRFLRNPHYEAALRDQTGQDPEVDHYIAEDPEFSRFFDSLTTMLAPLLPRYEMEGKSYLTIAFGCTGGRHRSVALAERLARWIETQGRPVTLVHRDLGQRAERR